MTTKLSGHLTESEKEAIDDYLTGNRDIFDWNGTFTAEEVRLEE